MPRGKPKFSPENIDQMKTMRTSGQFKRLKEIATEMNRLHPGLNATSFDVSKYTSKEEGKVSAVKQSRKASIKCTPVHVEPQPATDDLASVLADFDAELKGFMARCRAVARREIVKYIARLRKARIKTGEQVTPEEEERLQKQMEEFDLTPADIKEVGL